MADTSVSPDSTEIISDTTSDTNQPTTGADAVVPPTQEPVDQDTQPQGGTQPYMQSQQGAPQAPAGQQPQDDQQGPTNGGKPQDMSEAPSFQPNGKADATADAQHPLVQKAGWVFKTAQALAGGPRFKETVNPETGVTERTQIPMSRGDIGMAIAMEALSGALGGLAQQGPGATARAAAVGFGQQMQQREQQDAQQTQQANADYARHAQILETNMRTWQNAQTIGKKNYDSNVEYSAQFKPLADRIQQDYPQFVKGVINESDMAKYHVTKDSAMPTGNVIPTLDAKTGKQAVGSHGEPLWEHQYLVVDPNFKADGFLDEDDRKTLVEMHKQGFVDSDGKESNLPQSLPMKLSMGINLKSQIASYKLAKQDLEDFNSKVQDFDKKPPVDHTSNSVFKMFPTVDNLADFIVRQEGSDKNGTRGQRNNNPGNLIADPSWKGKVDTSNLAPEQHGVGYRVYDTPEEGRQALIKQLQLDQSRTPDATPEEFFKKYDATNPAAYAANARAAVAKFAPPTPQPGDAPADTSAKPAVPDLAAAVAKDPTLVKALGDFQPLLNAAQGNYEKAIGALGAKDPQAAGKVLALYGGSASIAKFDQMTSIQQDTAKKRAEAQVAVEKEKALAPTRVATAVATQNALNPGKVQLAGQEETARQAARSSAGGASLPDMVKDPNVLAVKVDPNEPLVNGARTNYLKALNEANPGFADLIKGIGEGRQVMSDYGLAKNDGQMLAKYVAQAYPGYDSSKTAGYKKARDSFSAGDDAKQIEAGNTTMLHAAEYVRLANSTEASIPFTHAYNRLATITPQLVEEVNSAYTKGVLHEDKREQLENGLTSSFAYKRIDSAQQVMDLLADKVGQKQRTWERAKPSPAVPDFSLISPEAQDAYKMVTGKTIDEYGKVTAADGKPQSQAKAAPVPPQKEATHIVPGPDGQDHWTNAQGTADYGIVK